jgi:polyphosphate kinase 2 (PPK2 family)
MSKYNIPIKNFEQYYSNEKEKRIKKYGNKKLYLKLLDQDTNRYETKIWSSDYVILKCWLIIREDKCR